MEKGKKCTRSRLDLYNNYSFHLFLGVRYKKVFCYTRVLQRKLLLTFIALFPNTFYPIAIREKLGKVQRGEENKG